MRVTEGSMDKAKKINIPVLINSLLLVVRLIMIVFICEVYKQNTYIIERGYPVTESNYFSISVGWLPIILASVCLAINLVRLFLAYRRKPVSYKTDATSLVAEIIVAIFYMLPVIAATKNIPATAFKAVFITLCALLAAFTLFRGVFYITKTTLKENCSRQEADNSVKNINK